MWALEVDYGAKELMDRVRLYGLQAFLIGFSIGVSSWEWQAVEEGPLGILFNSIFKWFFEVIGALKMEGYCGTTMCLANNPTLEK